MTAQRKLDYSDPHDVLQLETHSRSPNRLVKNHLYNMLWLTDKTLIPNMFHDIILNRQF